MAIIIVMMGHYILMGHRTDFYLYNLNIHQTQEQHNARQQFYSHYKSLGGW